MHSAHAHDQSGNVSSIMKRRLKLNPQLRQIKLTESNLDMLEAVSKNTPNLQELDVFEFFGTNGTFSVDRSYLRRVQTIPIVFSNLEEFTSDDRFKLWLDVIKRNKQHIKKIKLGWFSSNELNVIANKFLNLEEFTINLGNLSEGFSLNFINAIKTLVEQPNQLRKLSFLVAKANVSEALTNLLLTDWYINKGKFKMVFHRIHY